MRRRTSSRAGRCTARATTARPGSAPRSSGSPRAASSSSTRRGTWSPAGTASSGSAATRACSSARTTRASPGRRTEAILHHETRDQWRPGRGRHVPATRSTSIPTTAKRMLVGISAAGVVPDRRRRRDLGAVRTRGRRADFLPDAQAGGRPVRPQGAHPSREARTGSGSRTTAASIAPTTAATRGSGSTGTGCRATSGSR